MSCTYLWVTLKFTIEASLDNNKYTARVSTNTPNFKLKGEFIVMMENMGLYAFGLDEQ